MCNNCIHKAVCSIYRATGGVKKCEHFKEERKGEWLEGKTLEKCSICGKKGFPDWRYCPSCGADMRGAEDGK